MTNNNKTAEEKVPASTTIKATNAEPELPPFTFKNVACDIVNGVKALVVDPFTVRIVAPLIILATSLLCKWIILHVPYTEIDFSTYMQQIELINEGELDYKNIQGDSGPIVYPAGFVQIYQFLYQVTNGGANLGAAQTIFGYLMALTNLFVVISYTTADSVAPWCLYLLLLSKRLFSIYVLRLFNDCFTTFCMVAVTVILQQASYWATDSPLISFLLTMVATDLYSLSVTIKMNALLYLPAILMIVYFLCRENPFKFAFSLMVFIFVQVTTAWKFLLPFFNDEDAQTIRWNYITQAFNFKRKFLYKWTVNWRFLSEDIFSSDKFGNALLIGNLSVLLVFAITRFLTPSITGKSLRQLFMDFFKPRSTIAASNVFLNHKIGPHYILLILSITNLIGVVFSRSLHYQFLSWYCWQLPYLLYSTGWPFYVCVPLWFIHEYCWNVFPSTPISSALLIGILSLIIIRVHQNTAIWSH